VSVPDADRDALAEALGRHYAADALDAEELDARLDALYAAPTHAAAAAVLDGLPPLPAAEAPRRRGWRRRGHGEADRPQPGWLPTTERFRDPGSGRLMRVWVDPAAGGARHYVAEG
jgi:hypothetical protein